MFTKITFYISEQDRNRIALIQEHHPEWSPAVIFRKTLAAYAAQFHKTTIKPIPPTGSAEQDIELLWGPDT